MHILSVGTALPAHAYSQAELVAALTAYWSTRHHNPARVEQLHRAVQVGGRCLALPIERYPGLRGFGERNDAFVAVGLELAERALRQALDRAGLRPDQLDAIFTVSVTGLAVPSLDARLINRLGLRTDIVRVPIFGLGCVAGAAGVARLGDWMRAWPGRHAALVSVELCSLTLQHGDLSVPNLIASGLFGDGAAAVIAGPGPSGDEPAPGPALLAWQSRFYPDTERVMGWDVGDEGFRIVLSAEVPAVVERFLGQDVDGFLARQGLGRADIGTWVCHPGGPKVLEAFERVLELPPDALARTWESLRAVGNLSSASVLFVLGETMAAAPPPGSLGLMIAMGPGFCSELVLLRW